MKTVKTIIALLVISVMLLSACAPAAPAEPQIVEVTKEVQVEVEKEVVVTQVVEVEKDMSKPVPGGTLVVTTPGIVHLDVDSVNTFGLNFVIQPVYETLFDRVEDEIVPLLAESNEVSADGLTHTIKIRSGVKFHDGTDFNAEVAKWNLDRKINEKLPLADQIPFESVTAPDANTLVIKLTRAYPPIYGYLSTKTFSMYSPKFVEEVGADGLKNGAVGTGPFTVAEYVPNEKLIYKKNPNYWQPGLPYLDEIDVLIVPDANTRATMLESGEANISSDLSIQDTDRFKFNDAIKVWSAPSSRYYYVSMTTVHEPLTDKKVRQAFNYAVDKNAMVKSIFLNYVTPAKAHIATEIITGFKGNEPYAYDPEKAKALMDEAGFKDTNNDGWREWNGKPVELVFRTRTGVQPGDIETAEAVQGYLADVGVKVKIEIVDTASFLAELNKPIEEAPYYDMVNLSWGTFTGDADYAIKTAIVCGAKPGVYYNYPSYCNPEVDALVAEADKTATMEERNEYFAKVFDTVWDDAISIYLFQGISTIATGANVKGLYSDPAQTIYPFKWAWLAE